MIITGVSNEKNKWINRIWSILSKRLNILPTRTSFFISSAGKIESEQEFKIELPSTCFIALDSHVIIVGLHVVVCSKHDILHFWDNVHLFKYYPVKAPQNCFYSFNYSNQSCIQVSKFSFALGEWTKLIQNFRKLSEWNCYVIF